MILTYGIAAVTVVIGLIVYWHLKWAARRQIPQDSFGTFFLAGERVGQELTAHNSWGLGFAFANSVWYFAFLGYNYGPWAFLLQIPWVLAIAGLGLLLRGYLVASSSGTVHGFISHNFGSATGLMAAVATLIGYCLNVGFEMFYSAHLLTAMFNMQSVELIVAIMIAIFVGAYCTAGGYYASVVTDKYQNIVGTVAISIVIGILTPLLIVKEGTWSVFSITTQFKPIPWHFILGIAVFAFFFNFVDMANWQSLAANRGLSEPEKRKVSRGLFYSALVQLAMPAFAGVWLGCMIKALNSSLQDDQILAFAIKSGFSDAGLVAGILLGFTIFGFVSLTLSSAGSYLVAAMQTLAIDVVKRRQIARYDNPNTSLNERHIIEQDVLNWVKRNVLVASLCAASVFAFLYYGLDYVKSEANVFQFQFVMYGCAVTLVPTVLSQLLSGNNKDVRRAGGFSSILIGLVSAIGPFIFATFFWNASPLVGVKKWLPVEATPEAIINLTPVFGFTAATLTFFVVRKLKR